MDLDSMVQMEAAKDGKNSGSQSTKYKELGEEIDKRVKDGKRLGEVIARLEVIRMSIYNLKTVKALVDGIRIARGDEPFNPALRSRISSEVDVKDALR
jgi:hypothetical protein